MPAQHTSAQPVDAPSEKNAPRPGKLALLLNATRAPYLTAILVPVLLGAAIAYRDGLVNIPLTLLTLIAVALFHLGSNVANDYFDHLSGADEANQNPSPFFGGSRVIQRGLLQPHQVRNLALALYALGSLLGFVIAYLTGHPLEIVLLGLIGLGIGVLYTAPPIRLAHHGIGEFFLGIAFGPLVVVGTYFVLSGAWSLESLYASIPVALLIVAVLYINEIPDRPWDAQAGKQTLVARLPLKMAVDGYGVLIAATYLTILIGAALHIMPLATLVALATAPLAWSAIQVLQKNYAAPYQMIPANAGTIQVHLLTGLLLSAAYMVAGMFHF